MADVHTYKFNVAMTCGSCSAAVGRVLTKAKDAGDVTEFSVDLPTQEVVVKGTLSYDEVYAKIQKTGKEIRSGETVE